MCNQINSETSSSKKSNQKKFPTCLKVNLEVRKTTGLILLLSLLLTISGCLTSTVKAQTSSVTFWERGVGSDFTGDVATIGGGGCTVIDLGTCYTITTLNDITFTYNSPLTVSQDKQYVWIYTTSEQVTPPVSTQSGIVPGGASGIIFGYYTTQYSVSISTSPTGAGIVNPSGSNVWMNEGVNQISATPISGNSFQSWSVTGAITINDPNTATTSVTISGPGTITANFINQSSAQTYSLSPFTGEHGSIYPSVPVGVKQGADKTFTFTPEAGFRVSTIIVDGKLVPVANSYTFTNVNADHSIRVAFEVIPPLEISVIIDSNPKGSDRVTVDGISITTPQTFNWPIGSVHRLNASTLVPGEGGVRYAFSTWSNPASQVQNYTVSDTTTSITAEYNTQYKLTIKTNFGTVTPSDGSWYDAGSKVTLKAVAPTPIEGESFVFGGWKGSLGAYSGGSNPSGEFTMNGPVTEETAWQHIYQLKIVSQYGETQNAGWYEVDEKVHAVVKQTIVVGGDNLRYVFTGWAGDASGTNATSKDMVLDRPKTATADWKPQYQLIFTQSGLDKGVKGPVLTVNGKTLSTTDFPYVVGWFDSGAFVNYTYSTTLNGLKIGEVLTLNKVEGPTSPVSVQDAVNISASYNSTNILLPWINIGFVILAIIIAIILFIIWRRSKNS